MIMTQEEHQLFNEYLSDYCGLHFPDSKKEILESRLKTRMEALKLGKYIDYYYHLQFNGNGELQNLMHAVTNNESYFFRETRQFEAVFEHALDDLKKGCDSSKTLRFLIAGCSTGEEPYTLNIFAKENQYQLWGHTVAIDAIDIDKGALQVANRAEYGLNSLRSLDDERINKHFKTANNRHILKEMFRHGVTCQWGNILKVDTYRKPVPYDVIFCRNVLIYFSEEAIHKAIDNFAQCLRPGGLLFLGHSEFVIGISNHFQTVRLGNCVAYQRLDS